jgi:hypothetical protein
MLVSLFVNEDRSTYLKSIFELPFLLREHPHGFVLRILNLLGLSLPRRCHGSDSKDGLKH